MNRIIIKGIQKSEPHLSRALLLIIIEHQTPTLYFITWYRSIVAKAVKESFGCFVEFSKAFDTVPRNILIQKRRDKGINGRILELIRTLYFNDNASVKIGKSFSSAFKTNIGVSQRCVLSLFVVELAHCWPAAHPTRLQW